MKTKLATIVALCSLAGCSAINKQNNPAYVYDTYFDKSLPTNSSKTSVIGKSRFTKKNGEKCSRTIYLKINYQARIIGIGGNEMCSKESEPAYYKDVHWIDDDHDGTIDRYCIQETTRLPPFWEPDEKDCQKGGGLTALTISVAEYWMENNN